MEKFGGENRNKAERTKIQYKERLLAAQMNPNQAKRMLFPFSSAIENESIVLTETPKQIEAKYAKVMMPYHVGSSGAQEGTCDFGSLGNADIGHKLHLNVSIEDVFDASEYLKDAGYAHKYLSGGNPLLGKIFTVYIGEKNLADRVAKRLSVDLSHLLRCPVAHEDVEYAPNIGGRFAVRAEFFDAHGQGLRGIPMLASDAEALSFGDVKPNPEWLRKAFDRSFQRCTEEYGEYFFGKEK